MVGGDRISAPMVEPAVYEFPTVAGGSYDIVPAHVAETEDLSATTSGVPHSTVDNAGFSDWQGQQLSASAVNDSVTYTVPNLSAGTYQVYVGADAGPNRGTFQLAAGPSGGGLTNIGSPQDTYAVSNLTQLLPMSLTPPTTLALWSHRRTEYDCGTLDVPATGSYDFQLTVVGKNASSSGYTLVLDYIRLSPVIASPGPTLDVALIGDQVVLSWSTNATGFSLKSTTNMPPGPWQPVLSAPAVVDDSYAITNDTTETQRYYRLEEL
jgi:hypothetical protein